VTTGEPWNRSLQAFAWAATGNAARVRRDDHGASTAFLQCTHLLESVHEDAAELPYRARAFDLLASYHRDLGGVFAALDHLDSAIFLAEQVEVRPDPEYQPRLLIRKSSIQAGLGDLDAALTSLAEAERALAGRPEGRLHACVAAHRLYALVEQGATEEARGLLPLAERLAERHLAGADLPRHLSYRRAGGVPRSCPVARARRVVAPGRKDQRPDLRGRKNQI
jgi:tetratricopeptide (TPR) repeat protein